MSDPKPRPAARWRGKAASTTSDLKRKQRTHTQNWRTRLLGLLRPLPHGFVHNLLERHILLLCQFTAIVKLWRSLPNYSVKPRDLHAHIAKARSDGFPI